MPETRYAEIYEQGTGKLLSREPYEVNDEELKIEAAIETIRRVQQKAKKGWTLTDIKDLLEALLIQAGVI